MKKIKEVYLFFLNILQDAMHTTAPYILSMYLYVSGQWIRGKNSFVVKDIFHMSPLLCLTSMLRNWFQNNLRFTTFTAFTASLFYCLAGIVINVVKSVAGVDPLEISRKSQILLLLLLLHANKLL